MKLFLNDSLLTWPPFNLCPIYHFNVHVATFITTSIAIKRNLSFHSVERVIRQCPLIFSLHIKRNAILNDFVARVSMIFFSVFFRSPGQLHVELIARTCIQRVLINNSSYFFNAFRSADDKEPAQ